MNSEHADGWIEDVRREAYIRDLIVTCGFTIKGDDERIIRASMHYGMELLKEYESTMSADCPAEPWSQRIEDIIYIELNGYMEGYRDALLEAEPELAKILGY